MPAFAAERRRLHLLIDSIGLSAADAGAEQQTHRPQLLLSIDETERRTEGRPTVP